ncbi:AraC family transcriptional regulator [Mesoflavibacter sp. CH_XMU1404-2]|uniref:helix-turn-helix domain-containing protein n=1 Tax=Mesoflavibacter sp. CH_XMU1404-2 TaxID=3107766 RepID=UPI00300A6F90
MTFNTIEILSFLVVFLLLFFALYLLNVKTTKKLSNILFAIFLIVTALDISSFFYHKFISVSYTFEMLRTQILSGLKEPLFYLYILSVIYDNFKLKVAHLIFFIPILISLVILYPNFFDVTVSQQEIFYNNYNSQPEIKIITGMQYILVLAYLVAEIYQVVRYRKIVKQNYSNPNSLINYKWLKQFLIIISIGILLTFIKNVLKFNTEDTVVINNIRILTLLFGVGLMSWLFSKALLAPKVFQGIDSSITSLSDKKIEVEDKRVQEIFEFMEKEKPYLDPSLTLQKLAGQLQINSRDLSVIINQQIGKHFFDFVNEYRIENAKKLLSENSKSQLTVLEILYEVGFNSKSSFNTSFKKLVGVTPTEYRKSKV